MFLTKPYKILPFSKQQTGNISQKLPKTALAVYIPCL